MKLSDLMNRRPPVPPVKFVPPIAGNPPEIPARLAPGETVPMAVQVPSPFPSPMCVIDGCKNTGSFVLVSGAGPMVAEFEQSRITADSPLAAQIEAAVARVQPGRLVPEPERRHLCEFHWHEFNAERARIAEAERAKRNASYSMTDIAAWPDHSYEIVNAVWFRVSASDGRSQLLQHWQMAELKAAINGQKFAYEALNEQEIKRVKLRATLTGMANDTASRP